MRQQKWTLFSLTITLFILVGILVACGGGAAESTGAPATAAPESNATPAEAPATTAATAAPTTAPRPAASPTGAAQAETGEPDARTLPKYPGAETVYEDQATSISAAAVEVAAVVDFARKELPLLGWQEFVRPFSQSADDPNMKALMFKKDGVGLSVFITVAPAQGGKTSLQYSFIPLARDLPALADATEMEFDPDQLYLRYLTASDMDTVLKFYQEALPPLGWTAKDGAALIESDNAGVLFVGNEAGLALGLTRKDNQTEVILSEVPAEVLAEAETPEAPVADEQEVAGSFDLKSLPLPDDARDVSYDTSTGEVTYNSPAKIEALAEFHRQELPSLGWQEDEMFSMIQENVAFMQFNQGDASLTVNFFDFGLGDGTDVTLSVSGMEMAGQEVPEEPALTETGNDSTADPGPLPTIQDWPVPKDAEDVNISGEELTFSVPWSFEEVIEFYAPTYDTLEMGTGCSDDLSGFSSISCSSSNGQVSVNLWLNKNAAGGTDISISYTNYAVESPVETTPSGSGTGTITAVEENGLPVPDDYSNYMTEDSPFRKLLTATSAFDLETVLEFYRQELAARGWQEQAGATVKPAEASLRFENGEDFLALRLGQVSDGTEIKLEVKMVAAAKEAGILPQPGMARIIMGNFGEAEAIISINGQDVKMAAGVGADKPDGPTLDLKPGQYSFTVKIGGQDMGSDSMEVGPDETWGLLAGPGGGLPLQIY